MSSMTKPRVKKVMTMPLNLFFRFLQNKTPVQIWLYSNHHTKLEGTIIGFDEYMNLTLDNTFEVDVKSGKKSRVGRVMLKGECVTLVQEVK